MERHTTVPAALTADDPVPQQKRDRAGAHPIFLILLGGVVALLVFTVIRRI